MALSNSFMISQRRAREWGDVFSYLVYQRPESAADGIGGGYCCGLPGWLGTGLWEESWSDVGSDSSFVPREFRAETREAVSARFVELRCFD